MDSSATSALTASTATRGAGSRNSVSSGGSLGQDMSQRSARARTSTTRGVRRPLGARLSSRRSNAVRRPAPPAPPAPTTPGAPATSTASASSAKSGGAPSATRRAHSRRSGSRLSGKSVARADAATVVSRRTDGASSSLLRDLAMTTGVAPYSGCRICSPTKGGPLSRSASTAAKGARSPSSPRARASRMSASSFSESTRVLRDMKEAAASFDVADSENGSAAESPTSRRPSMMSGRRATMSQLMDMGDRLHREHSEMSEGLARGEYAAVSARGVDVIRLTLRKFGPHDPRLLYPMLLVARAQLKLGRTRVALEYLTSANLFVQDHPECWESRDTIPHAIAVYNDLAHIYMRERDYVRARDLYSRVCQEMTAYGGDLGTAYVNLGLAHQYTESGVEAREMFVRAVNWRAQRLGADHVQTARASAHLGELLVMLGAHAEALPAFVRSYAGLARADVPLEQAKISLRVATCLRELGKPEEAQVAAERALRLRELELGAGHDDTCEAMVELGRTQQDQGKLEDALVLYRRALRELREAAVDEAVEAGSTATGGEEAASHALAMTKCVAAIGDVHVLEADTAAALDAYTTAEALAASALGPAHAETVALGGRIADVLFQNGRADAAATKYAHILSQCNVLLPPEAAAAVEDAQRQAALAPDPFTSTMGPHEVPIESFVEDERPSGSRFAGTDRGRRDDIEDDRADSTFAESFELSQTLSRQLAAAATGEVQHGSSVGIEDLSAVGEDVSVADDTLGGGVLSDAAPRHSPHHHVAAAPPPSLRKHEARPARADPQAASVHVSFAPNGTADSRDGGGGGASLRGTGAAYALVPPTPAAEGIGGVGAPLRRAELGHELDALESALREDDATRDVTKFTFTPDAARLQRSQRLGRPLARELAASAAEARRSSSSRAAEAEADSAYLAQGGEKVARPEVTLPSVVSSSVSASAATQALLLNNLGNVLRGRVDRSGSAGAALACYRRSLALYSKAYGPDYVANATVHINIGNVLLSAGKLGEAKHEYMLATALRERLLGKDHPDTACCYRNLGTVYVRSGHRGDAVPWLRKAVRILSAHYGSDHATTRDANSILAAASRRVTKTE